MTKKHWFLLETEQHYYEAAARYETIKNITAGEEHQEKLLLVHLIAKYEEKNWDLPEVDPVEMIKIRMEDFGYHP
jgi:HTH-type transcriptional regulator/antitoxin HigA